MHICLKHWDGFLRCIFNMPIDNDRRVKLHGHIQKCPNCYQRVKSIVEIDDAELAKLSLQTKKINIGIPRAADRETLRGLQKALRDIVVKEFNHIANDVILGDSKNDS